MRPSGRHNDETTCQQTVLKNCLSGGYAVFLPGFASVFSKVRIKAKNSTFRSQIPQIVEVLDWGYSDGTWFLTQDYCWGGNLRQLLKSRGPLPVKQACQAGLSSRPVGLALQVLEGLEYAHSQQIPVRLPNGEQRTARPVHRDIEPANLLLTGQEGHWIVNIGDWGLAKGVNRPRGDVASNIVVSTLPGFVQQAGPRLSNLKTPEAQRAVAEILSRMSDQLRDGAAAQLGLQGMGSTVVLALLRNDDLLIGHIGDSRVYRLRDHH